MNKLKLQYNSLNKKRMTAYLLSILIAASLLIPTLFTLAAAGDLDTTFAGTGYIIDHVGSNESSSGNAVLVQDDGKIIVVGSSYDFISSTNDDFAAVRYNSNGTLDTTFNGDGKLTTDFGTSVDGAADAILQADGKMIVVGHAKPDDYYHFALARYDQAGDLDPAFDGDGRVTTVFAAQDALATAVTLQSDGKILVAGYTQAADGDIALARYLTNGALDTSFSGDGLLTTSIGTGQERAYDVLVQPDGKIIVAGENRSGDSFTPATAVALRYNSDGSLDTAFGDAGVAVAEMQEDSIAYGAALQGDGKIIIAGQALGAGYYYFGVARFETDGSPDTSVAGVGYVTIYPEGGGTAQDVVIQPDGKILVAGTGYTSGHDFTLMRFNTQMGMDDNFGTDGIAYADPSVMSQYAAAVALQPDGKILVSGETDYASYRHLTVARFQSDAPPPIGIVLNRYTFGSGGGVTSGDSLTLRGSIGQNSPIGQIDGTSLRLRAGFWHAAGNVPGQTSSTQVDPGTGGSLNSPDNRVGFQFPPGSVNGATTVTYIEQSAPGGSALAMNIQRLSAGSPDENLVFAGKAFQLEAADGNGPVTSFLLPYTLTLLYAESDLQHAGIRDESSLNLYYWDEGTSDWVGLLPCDGCSLDTGNNILIVLFDSTGEFALLGDRTLQLFLPIILR